MADNEIDPDVELDPAPEQDTQPAEDDLDPTEATASDEDNADPDEDGQGEQEAAPELIDWDLGDGKKVKVPSVVKDALLRQQDYTRKTQEVAEQRKALEAERESLSAFSKAEKELQTSIGKLAHVEDQLARFAPGPNGTSISVNDIDWVTWQQRNPREAQQALQRAQALERQRGSLQRAVEEGKQKHESETKQATAKRLADTRAFAEKEIPNWSPERDKAIAELLGSQLGIPEDEVLRFISPKTYQLADLALDGFKYREARAKRKAAPQPASNVTPLKAVGQRGGAPGSHTRDPAKMTMDQYAKWRAAQDKEAS